MLLPVTVAFLAGLLLGSYLPFCPLSGFVLLLLAALAFSFLEHQRRLPRARSLVLYGSLLAGVLYWTLAAWMVTGRGLAAFAGEEPTRIIGTVVEPVRQTPGRVVIVLSGLQLGREGEAVPVVGRLRLTWREPDRVVGQGDRVVLTSRIRPVSGTVNPGGFDYAASLERKGIFAVASVSGPGQVVVLSAPGLWSWWTPWRVIDDWRARIRLAAERSLSGAALGIYLGIIIGEPGYLSPEQRDAFMATGTVHILSISGSHLGLIAFLSFFVIQGLCRRLPIRWLQTLSRRMTATRLAALVTVLPVTFYTLLAGAEVATVRSLVMILIFLLSVWLGREQHLLLALASAALLIVLHDPDALYDISFQLSYLSVLAIALVVTWRMSAPSPLSPREVKVEVQVKGVPPVQPGARPQPSYWRGEGEGVVSRSGEWLRNYLWITVAVTLATVPLVAYHFNQIAWLGLLANLLVVPLAGLLLVPLGLGSAIWLLLVGSDVLPAGPLNQGLLDFLSATVGWLARVPGAEWHVASPAIPLIALYYVLLVAAARPGDGRLVRQGCVVSLMFVLAWWAWSPRWGQDGETVRVTFLDVGQGDACVIELPDGQTVLIDAGAAYDTLDMGRTVVGPYLWDRGIRRLDHVIATHPQLDHVGGVPWVLGRFEVGRYWGNGVQREERVFRRLRDALRERGLEERIAAEGGVITADGPCRFEILNPPPGRAAAAASTPAAPAGSILNNLSVVTRLECGRHSFLFTADIETAALARLTGLGKGSRSRVVKVPHHGARSSLHPQWLDQILGDVAVISVGRHNPYGHPAPTVTAAYEERGLRLYRTDRDGAVSISATLSAPDLAVHTAREEALQAVRFGRASIETERRNLLRLWRRWTGAV